jgi:CheY-like chemotaxis protein
MMNRLKTVLVVEDSAEDADFLRFAAEKAGNGLAFHFVCDGEQAIAYLKGRGQFSDRHAHPFPDLVLLDLGLPDMHGLEVLAWIREQPELGGLPVHVWTDAGQPEMIHRATKAGANAFVPKSVVFVRGGMTGLMNGFTQALRESAPKPVSAPSAVHSASIQPLVPH